MIGGLTSDEINACAEIVRKGDPDRFRVAMAAPPDARARMLPVLALNVEAARAPYLTAEPIIAQMRLQWWHDAVAEAVAGQDRAHEVAGPLGKIIRNWGLPKQSLDRLISARMWDIEGVGFDDDAAFQNHINATGGELLRLAAVALGLPEDREGAALDAGYAMGLANWFLAIPALEASGKRPLVDGRLDAVRTHAEIGLDRLTSAKSEPGLEPAFPAFRLAALAGPVLSQVRHDPASVADGRLAISEFRKRARILRLSILGAW